MDNPNICINCETLNTPESIFCKHCGKLLPGKTIDPALDARISNEIDSLVKAKKEQLNDFADNLENKIELNSIKKIDGWLRTGGIMGAIFAIIYSIFAILGGTTAWNLLTDKIKQTTELAEKANKDISEMVNNAQEQMRKLEEMEALTKAQISNIAKQADKATENTEMALKASTDAQNASDAVRNIRDKTTHDVADIYKRLDKQTSNLISKIQQTANATFDVFINLDGDMDSKILKDVMDTLQHKGFRISASNVMSNVEVIQNEIDYFSSSGEDKAKEIRAILKPFYNDIQLSFKKNSDRGASELLLKLKDRM
jgi:hypothetical protein